MGKTSVSAMLLLVVILLGSGTCARAQESAVIQLSVEDQLRWQNFNLQAQNLQLQLNAIIEQAKQFTQGLPAKYGRPGYLFDPQAGLLRKPVDQKKDKPEEQNKEEKP